jgi:hypothetical protein
MAKKKRTPEDAALLIDPVAAAGALVTLTATLGSILSNAQLAVLAIAQGKVPENVGAALLAGVAGAGELPAKKKRKKKVKLPEGYPKPPLRSGWVSARVPFCLPNARLTPHASLAPPGTACSRLSSARKENRFSSRTWARRGRS